MAIPKDFVESWGYLHPSDAMATMTVPASPGAGAYIWLENEIRPSDLFCYLGARFGRPNGLLNYLRSNDSDNLIHWEWVLRSDPGYISFMGTNFRTDVFVRGRTFDEMDKQELIRQIKQNFSRFGKQMKEIRNSLEPWVEFVNPYQRLRSSVTQLLSRLDALELSPEKDSSLVLRDESDQKAWESSVEKYSQATGICFGIRAMLPVMAEAYVNMLIYLLMRPELKADLRLRENTFRQHIDIRVKSLNVTCIGFERAIDYSETACSNFHSLINERNDLLHGNVSVEKLAFNELYFWGKVPIFKEYRSMWNRSIGVEVKAVGLDRVRAEVAIVNAFTEYLLSCVSIEIRPDVKRMLDTRDLGYNSKTNRTGLLFPNWLVDFHPVFGASDHPNEGTETSSE